MVLIDKTSGSTKAIGKGGITKRWAEFLAKSNGQRYVLGEEVKEKPAKAEPEAAKEVKESEKEDTASDSDATKEAPKPAPKRKRRPKKSE